MCAFDTVIKSPFITRNPHANMQQTGEWDFNDTINFQLFTLCNSISIELKLNKEKFKFNKYIELILNKKKIEIIIKIQEKIFIGNKFKSSKFSMTGFYTF